MIRYKTSKTGAIFLHLLCAFSLFLVTFGWHVTAGASPTAQAQAGPAQPAATQACTQWNLSADFKVAPNQQNPNPDSCGSPGVWQFLTTDPPRQAYHLLESFTDNLYMVPGLQQWYTPTLGSINNPSVGINATGQDYQGVYLSYTWPAGDVRVTLANYMDVVAGWRSPIDGIVSVTGSVTYLERGGYGLAWFIDQNAVNLASGAANATAKTQSFSQGVGGGRLSRVLVKTGDFLYFVVDPVADAIGDEALLDIQIQQVPGISLDPPEQTLSAKPGESLRFVETLWNYTGVTDTIQLSLGASAWPAAISGDDSLSLGAGQEITFTVDVTVPLGAAWYATNPVPVSAATSLHTPVYTSTALLTAAAYEQEACARSPAGLVSWWPGDAFASDIADNNDGALHGDVSLAPGKVGQAFSLDGNGDYISVPDAKSLNPQTFSVEAWFYQPIEAQHYYYYPLVKKTSPLTSPGVEQTTGYSLEVYDTVKFSVFTSNAYSSANSQYVVNPYSQTWYHAVGTYNGSEVRLYLNGKLQQVTPASGSFVPSSDTLYIGGEPGKGFFYGLEDEVRLYNRALTDFEVQALYKTGGGICQPKRIYLKPDSQSGAALRGSTVRFTETVGNLTGVADTIQLASKSTWPVTLSENAIPLANGEEASFTVEVAIPPEVAWNTASTVVITATSSASPTVYAATAQLTARAYFSPDAFLPVLSKPPKPPSGITGKVTLNGSPTTNVPVELLFYNGTAWSTIATAYANWDGIYLFKDVPALTAGQRYAVRYTNEYLPDRLYMWTTGAKDTYDGASMLTFDPFDIANIVMTAPAPGAVIKLPYTFTWTPRPTTPTDSYELNLFDPKDGDPWAFTNPLGYVGSFVMGKLPTGFKTGVPYGWELVIYSPDGGFGISYYYYIVTIKSQPRAPQVVPRLGSPVMELRSGDRPWLPDWKATGIQAGQ